MTSCLMRRYILFSRVDGRKIKLKLGNKGDNIVRVFCILLFYHVSQHLALKGKWKKKRKNQMIGKKRETGCKSESSETNRENGTEKVLLELKPTLRNYLLLRTYWLMALTT